MRSCLFRRGQSVVSYVDQKLFRIVAVEVIVVVAADSIAGDGTDSIPDCGLLCFEITCYEYGICPVELLQSQPDII